MLEVRIPHVHAPHGEIGGWRGFATHVAIIAVGLLLALGLEQGVEYINHEFQRATLESQMRATFQSNIIRAERDITVLNNLRAYFIELKEAVSARIAGVSNAPPNALDPRNVIYAPPPNLGAYEASKINGSVGLLGLNRIRLYDRIEFQHNLMEHTFERFIVSLSDLRAFADRFNHVDDFAWTGIPQPNIDDLSAAQLVEYQTLLANAIEYTRMYARQLENNRISYQFMLSGADNLDTLLDTINKPPAKH